MGGQQGRRGKHLYLCFALLILLPACGVLRGWREQREVHDSMRRAHQFFARGDYGASLQEYRQVLSLARNQAPADAAYFNIGLIYAAPQNPAHDSGEAIESFKKVASDFAESPWSEQAKIWIAVLNQAEQLRQANERSKDAIEHSQQQIHKFKQAIEKSRRELEKSKQLIERANQVDIEIEQKRREQGK